MLLLGQHAIAQTGKRITSIHHEFTAESRVWEKQAGTEDATFTYDGQGRITSGHTVVTLPTGTMEFTTTYDFNEAAQKVTGTTSVLTPTLSAGYTIEMIAESLLENNLIKEHTITTNVTGAQSEIDQQFWERDGQGRIIKVTQHDPTHPDRDTYDVMAWENGNIVSTTNYDRNGSGHVTTHTYDMTRQAPQAAWLAFALMSGNFQVASIQMLMGASDYFGPMPLNLVTANSNSSRETAISYEYDADGDITKIEVRYDNQLVSTYTFGLGTTAISAIEHSPLNTEHSGVYNLNGQRVSQPTKGLYIRNGRKVIVK